MKRAEVFFHPMKGSGQLSISWSSALKGAAVEANGVGFFLTKGDLLSVIFDDVSEEEDHQVLEFKKCKIEISVQCGSVKHKVIQTTHQKSIKIHKKNSKIIKTTKKTTRSTLKRPRSKISH